MMRLNITTYNVLIETSARDLVAPDAVCDKGFATVSLMALGLVPVETVNHYCFSYAQGKPILPLLLQADVELRYPLLLLFRDAIFAVELQLFVELAR